ncbi:hypothetical protein [Pseudomonas sp. dw_612]|uniref:hypothetical protein n=1 Tax=Pseudomonas sp. dw_612 TaxID=2720080 RepID=UPI001BD5B7DA|nr:hypothetical protein [Pseudomonas sp. dw_612]
MKPSLNIRICILMIVAFCILFFGVAIAGIYNFTRTATYAAFASCFILFLTLLDMRQDRVLKGFFLIGAGVLYQIVYPKFFYIFVTKSLMPADAIDHFEIFGQVILLACAGAGGSIIAVYADKTSSDNELASTDNPTTEKPDIEKIVIDNTAQIEQLIKSTTILSRKLNIMIATTATAIVATITILTISLMR